jgi:hypothetical protein
MLLQISDGRSTLRDEQASNPTEPNCSAQLLTRSACKTGKHIRTETQQLVQGVAAGVLI